MPLGHRGRRTMWATASIGALLVTAVACGSDSGDPQASTATTATAHAVDTDAAAATALLPASDPNQTLPPNDVGSLRRLYDPALAAMGLRLTRGALIDTSNEGYEPSDSGTHLALYVEPIDDAHTPADYVDGLWTLSAVVTPDVFARWPDVQSYDICQEPPPSVDDEDEPLPYTQINLTRAVAESIDWTNGSLPTLLMAARTSGDLDLVISKEIRESPEYKAANKTVADQLRDQGTTSTTGG